VSTATNGQDAIDLIETQTFEIVFLDENMPGMSGLETLQEIKRLRPQLPVVMITKSEEEHIMEQAIGEKIADYLIKPVNPSQILLCLKKHIHQHAIITEHRQENYRQEWSDISYMIDTATTIDEWKAIERAISKWDIELENSSMRSLLEEQRVQANAAFSKWVQRHYEGWFAPNASRPLMSHDVMKQVVFPLLDKGEKVLFLMIDNFSFFNLPVLLLKIITSMATTFVCIFSVEAFGRK
jgi:YesN/AraC family two-component response regulator